MVSDEVHFKFQVVVYHMMSNRLRLIMMSTEPGMLLLFDAAGNDMRPPRITGRQILA